MDTKLGVYICTGCDIGESLDVDKLVETANDVENFDVELCKTHAALCSKEGVEFIKKDLDSGEINRVMVAACSPRVHFDTFKFENTILERCNLREQVVWCHKPNDEDTQMLAEDYIRMYVAKTHKCEPIEPFIGEDLSKTILVIGGGIAGMTAALEVANTDYNVVLVEKDDKLGGFVNKLYKQYPTNPPYDQLEQLNLAEKVQEIQNHGKIKVYLSSTIESVSGQPGEFQVKIKKGDAIEEEKIGSIIVAAGFKPYEVSKLEHLGYGKCPNVISSVTMEELATAGKINRPSDNKEAKSVAFIQCAGSRDKEHLPYCSSVSCLTSLKQAKYVREKNPDAKVYMLYKDMRTPAQYEIFYKNAQQDEQIFLTKGEVVNVEAAENDTIIIDLKDTLLGEKISIKVDMAVLATGMVPTTLTEEVLNLTYRKGKELPPLVEKYGFPDSHFVCFPYETQRTAIFATGSVRHPSDINACIRDSRGAALKAIQAVNQIGKGAALHPRAGDMTYPDFFLQRCTQCKRCTEECPFGTLDEDEKGTPKPNPNRCRRCGVCMGACPERIVSFKDYNVDMIVNMIKAVEVPDEDEEKPRIIAFVCENDAYPALDIAGMKRSQYNSMIRFIPVRCLGSFNVVWVATALDKGYDGIMLMGCKHGDDYQCHFIKGSELAEYRMGTVQERLDQLMLESERVQILQIALQDYDKIPQIMDDFLEVIEDVGPNPFKGM